MLQEGDILIIETPTHTLVSLESEPGIKISPVELHKRKKTQKTLQMLIPHNFFYTGKKIGELHLNKMYKAVVAAVKKGINKARGRLDKVKLHLGDRLIVKTTSEYVEKLRQDSDIMVKLSDSNYKKDKIGIAIVIMAGVVGVAALGIYPTQVTSLVGIIAICFLEYFRQIKHTLL